MKSLFWKSARIVSPIAILAAVVSVGVSPALAGDRDRDRHRGYVDGSEFAGLAEEDSLLVEVSLSGSLLKMVAKAVGNEVGEAADLLSDIVSIHAVVVGIEENADRARRMVGEMGDHLTGSGWDRLAQVREDDVHVMVFALPADDGAIDGLTVMVSERSEDTLVFANIAGRIDLELVAKLGSGLDIPGLEHLAGHSLKSEIKKHKKHKKHKK